MEQEVNMSLPKYMLLGNDIFCKRKQKRKACNKGKAFAKDSQRQEEEKWREKVHTLADRCASGDSSVSQMASEVM